MSTNKKTESIGYKLKKTQHSLRLHMDDALKVLDLTTPQYAVLAQLEINHGISNADLARASFITAQTMHAIVINLEKRGLISRTNDPKHGRKILTELTTEGIKILYKARELVKVAENKMMHNFTEKDRLIIEKLLSQCFDNLELRNQSMKTI